VIDRSDATRRDFLVQMAGLGMLLSRPEAVLGSGLLQNLESMQDLLPTRRIPVSGEEIPIVGFGSSAAVIDILNSGTEPIVNVLRILRDHGARVVDTSIRSAPIDEAFGKVLQRPEFRDRLFVTSKVNTEVEQEGLDQMRQTQRLFGRRTLDLVQIESLRGLELHWPHLQEWREAGEARYIGVTVANDSNHERMEAFIRAESPDFIQVNLSVVETAAEDRLLPLARDRGMAVLTNRPFMNGAWFRMVQGRELPEWPADFDCVSWAQFSVKYVLSNPAVTCALTETSDPAHMAENLLSGVGRLPDEVTRSRMRELVGGF
jgi:diketogulonate reductase-like aldo/keto reductase